MSGGLIDLCVNADVLLIYISFAKSIRERLKGGMCVQMQTKEKTEEFLKIAIPAVLESLVSVIIATIDTKMIAVLGKQAISAVSFTTQPKLIFFSIFFLFF